MKHIVYIAIALLLSSCGTFKNVFGNGGGYSDDDNVIVTRPPNVYSRSDVDALTAEIQCRQLARSMLEAQRCGIRR